MNYIIFIVGIIASAFVWLAAKRKILYFKGKDYSFLAVLLIVPLILECFVFNFNSFQFQSDDYRETEFTVTTQSSSDGNGYQLEVTDIGEGRAQIALSLLRVKTKVRSITVIPSQDVPYAEVTVGYKDEATNDGIADAKMKIAPGNGSGSFSPLYTVGTVDSLKLTIVPSSGAISTLTVKINHPKDFYFNVLRYLLCMLLCAGVLLLRKGGKAHRVMYSKRSIRQKVIAAVLLMVQLVFIAVLLLSPKAVFDASGKIDGFAFLNLTDAYHELTDALAEGQFSLLEEPPAALEELENPYEPQQRSGIGYYRWDRAYYDGEYYCYFGIVPAVLVYLPYRLINGTNINSTYVCLLFAVITAIFLYLTAFNLAGRWKRRLPFILVAACALALVNGCMLLYCIASTNFYEVATLSALAFAAAGMYFTMLSCPPSSKIKKLPLIAAALCLSLSVGCRPNFLLVTPVALSFIFASLYRTEYARGKTLIKVSPLQKAVIATKSYINRENIISAVVFAVPFICVMVPLMYYNYARFDSPFEFGAAYQLTLYDTSKYSPLDFGKIPVTIWHYLLAFPEFSADFPFVKAVYSASNYMGFHYTTSYFGIFANPLLWLFIMLPWAMKRGIKKNGLRLFTAVCLCTGLLMSYLCCAMGGTSLRYAADFAWLIFIPVIPVVFSLYSASRLKKTSKYMLQLLVLFASLTVLLNALISISPSKSDIMANNPNLFYFLKDTFVFWL